MRTGPEGIFQRLQSPFLQIDISEIVLHEADQPDSVFDFANSDRLTRERFARD